MQPFILKGMILPLVLLGFSSLLLVALKVCGLVFLTWAQALAPVWFPALVLAVVFFMVIFAS